MMKKMKMLTLLLVTMMCMSTACSTSNTKQAGNNEGSQVIETNTKSKEEVVTIKLSNWYPKASENWDKVIKAFETAHPNIKIDFVSAEDNNSNEFYKKLDLAAASGDDLDVIMFSNMNFVNQRASLGMLEPLNSFLDEEGVTVKDEYLIDTTIDETVYGLPGKLSTSLIFINEEHLKAANLELPKKWTWDQFMDYSKTLTTTENGKTRYGTYFHSWASFSYFIQNLNTPINANLVTDDGRNANIDTDLVRKTLEVRLRGENEGSVTPYSEVISQKLNYRPLYFNKDISMLSMGAFLISEVGGTEQVPATFKTVFAPIPTVNENDPISANATSDVLSIYSKSKHKQEAYTFIRWFTTEGIVLQGKNIPSWKDADMNQVLDEIIQGTKSPEMIDKESLLYVLNNTLVTTAEVPVPYHAEIEKVFTEEFDKLMLSGQELDTTIKNAQERAQKIVDSKK